MRPNLAFLSTASNTILKPGGPLKWKKRLVKDARFSLPLTEMMKIARPTSPLLDMHRLSSPKSKAEAWQATCSSLSRKSNPKSVYSLLRSVAGFFPHLPPILTAPTVPLPGSQLRSSPITRDPTFPFLSQKLCVAELEATFPSSTKPSAKRSLTRPSAHPSPPLNFFQLPPTSPLPLELTQTKLPIPC